MDRINKNRDTEGSLFLFTGAMDYSAIPASTQAA